MYYVLETNNKIKFLKITLYDIFEQSWVFFFTFRYVRIIYQIGNTKYFAGYKKMQNIGKIKNIYINLTHEECSCLTTCKIYIVEKCYILYTLCMYKVYMQYKYVG